MQIYSLHRKFTWRLVLKWLSVIKNQALSILEECYFPRCNGGPFCGYRPSVCLFVCVHKPMHRYFYLRWRAPLCQNRFHSNRMGVFVDWSVGTIWKYVTTKSYPLHFFILERCVANRYSNLLLGHFFLNS